MLQHQFHARMTCRDSGGYGRATLLECLERLREQSNLPSLLPSHLGKVMKAICLALTRDSNFPDPLLSVAE